MGLGRAGRLRMVDGFGYARMIGEITSLCEAVLRSASARAERRQDRTGSLSS
jgi:hypothetical protein